MYDFCLKDDESMSEFFQQYQDFWTDGSRRSPSWQGVRGAAQAVLRQVIMTIREYIVEALRNLGGKACYADIYSEVERLSGIRSTVTRQASIRRCIEDCSSDCDGFKGRYDLFHSIYGKGHGVWGLR